MQMWCVILVHLLGLATFVHASESDASPITKVVQLLSDLETKIIAEGEAAQKLYEQTAEWCEDRSKDLQFEIKTGKSECAELGANILKETSNTGALDAKIEELSAAIADNDGDLKGAAEIRSKEAGDFGSEEKELIEITSMMERAIGLIEKEMKGGASMLQMQNAGSVAHALEIMVEAATLQSSDAAKLTALVQTYQSAKSESEDRDGSESEDTEEDGDAEAGAPAAGVYQRKSGSIVETLEDLLEKAQAQLSDARNSEVAARHTHAMTKQSLENSMGNSKKDMIEAKNGLSIAKEKKSTAEGSLAVATKELKADVSSLAELHQDCLAKAQDYESAVKSRAGEVKALRNANEVLTQNTGAAESTVYDFIQTTQDSFLQTRKSAADMTAYRSVRLVHDLARKYKSKSLAQLSMRMSSLLKSHSRSRTDPFSKVKSLISDMISRLMDEADADATHKQYCDKEMRETAGKKEEKANDIEELSTKIDQMGSAVAKLKGEITRIQSALAKLATSQAEMDRIRHAETLAFTSTKADIEQGTEGVKKALQVLSDYYGNTGHDHDASEGAGKSILGMLEVVESDFAQVLAEIEATEESAAAAYDQQTKDNQIETASKQAVVEGKAKEVTSLEKAATDANTDRSGTQNELDAVMEYGKTLEKQCVAKPETYDQRSGRRQAELAGLKEALTTLDGSAVLLQETSSKKHKSHSKRRLRHTKA